MTERRAEEERTLEGEDLEIRLVGREVVEAGHPAGAVRADGREQRIGGEVREVGVREAQRDEVHELHEHLAVDGARKADEPEHRADVEHLVLILDALRAPYGLRGPGLDFLGRGNGGRRSGLAGVGDRTVLGPRRGAGRGEGKTHEKFGHCATETMRWLNLARREICSLMVYARSAESVDACASGQAAAILH